MASYADGPVPDKPAFSCPSSSNIAEIPVIVGQNYVGNNLFIAGIFFSL